MNNEDRRVGQLLGEITVLVAAFPPALEHRASHIVASGKDSELADKLVKAADVMRDSGNMYVTWARHYAGLSEGKSEDVEEGEAEAVISRHSHPIDVAHRER